MKVRFGKAFGDHLKVEKRSVKHRSSLGVRGWGGRVSFFYFLLIFGMFVLGIRLFHVTVVQGAKYRQLSDGNRIREKIIHAPRGIILDRHGEPLVRNIPAFRLIKKCDTGKCAEILTQDEVLELESGGVVEKGELEVDVVREYLYGEEFAHVLGFLSEVNADELESPEYEYQDYKLGDRIGRGGLEEYFQKLLRGKDGKQLLEVDAIGDALRVIGKVDEESGENAVASLDRDLQIAAYEALGDKRGAVIASKPETGEILALVSKPSYDPNILQKGISQDEFDLLLNDEDRPMFNRAISGIYPPGSTFKIITATAGLEEGAIDSRTLVEDVGILKVGKYSYGNWYFGQYGKTEGQVDIIKAIARSNDIFFYKTGEWLGIEKLSDWGRRFGVGSVTGIEISGEETGVMPDPDWRQEVRGEQWFLGDTYITAIGQGDLQVTPLQVNVWTDVIANRGVLCKPTLKKNQSFMPKSGQARLKVQSCKDLKISKNTIELITEGMRRACDRGSESSYRGTGWPLFDFDPAVACKTGTAEFNDPDNKTHAWFTAFAPIDDPEISVTVLIEQGGEGSTDAGPVAKKVLEEWFGR